MSQDSVRTRLTTPTWCRRLPNTWVVLDNKGGSRRFRKKKKEKEKKKKGNTLNKLLPLLWSSNRGRRTALPSALNKHCGPTTTYKAGLDVRACRLERRGVSRGWAKEEPLRLLLLTQNSQREARNPCKAVAKTGPSPGRAEEWETQRLHRLRRQDVRFCFSLGRRPQVLATFQLWN